MAVHRSDHTKRFTIVDNGYLRDKRLSLEAKGMLTFMLSNDDNYQYSEEGLMKANPKNGKHNIKRILKELTDTGYLTRKRERDRKGMLRTSTYEIYEVSNTPLCEIQTPAEPMSDYPTLDNPTFDEPTLGNQQQRNTNNKKYQLKEVPILSEGTGLLNPANHPEAKSKATKQRKIAFGEFGHVMLSERDLNDIQTRYPETWKDWITRIDRYCEKTGKHYNNILLTIDEWEAKDKKSQSAAKLPDWYADTGSAGPTDDLLAEIEQMRKGRLN